MISIEYRSSGKEKMKYRMYFVVFFEHCLRNILLSNILQYILRDNVVEFVDYENNLLEYSI
jgi:hypothetical protein